MCLLELQNHAKNFKVTLLRMFLIQFEVAYIGKHVFHEKKSVFSLSLFILTRVLMTVIHTQFHIEILAT